MKGTKKEPSALHAEGSGIAVRLSREQYKYNTGGVLVSRVPFVILSEAKNPVRFAQGPGDPSLALRMTEKRALRMTEKGSRDKTRPVSRLPRRRTDVGIGFYGLTAFGGGPMWASQSLECRALPARQNVPTEKDGGEGGG